MRAMSESAIRVHMKEADVDLSGSRRMGQPRKSTSRCIECGCCVAACGTARMREDFVGAVGLNKIARFRFSTPTMDR